MKIGIIGAGKMGSALAIGLKNKGYDIVSVYSKTEESAEYLSQKIGCKTAINYEEAVHNSDVIFIAISDSIIEEISREMSKNIERRIISGKIFFHCSGALTSEVLNALQNMGAITGSFHPIQTFADKENGWKGLGKIYIGFEGDLEGQDAAQEIAGALNSKLLHIKKEDKSLYHAAACIVSNYVVTLSHISESIFSHIGMEEGVAVSAFTPLIKKTVDNIIDTNPTKALTGPISRGDLKTIENHLNSFNDKMPELTDFYKILGSLTVDLSLKKGTIDNEQSKSLKNKFM